LATIYFYFTRTLTNQLETIDKNYFCFVARVVVGNRKNKNNAVGAQFILFASALGVTRDEVQRVFLEAVRFAASREGSP